jgi:predicted negative regulator of RcsB-dependent stress response
MGDLIHCSMKKTSFCLMLIMTGILALLICLGWNARNNYFDERE